MFPFNIFAFNLLLTLLIAPVQSGVLNQGMSMSQFSVHDV